MEKAFCVLDSKINPVIARYHTLHRDVELVVLNKKYEWPNRVREEVLKCLKCRSFILPKDLKVHKTLCKAKKEVINDVSISQMVEVETL
jgi:hypothetical protein